MRLKHVKGAEEAIEASRYVIQEPGALKGRWGELGGGRPIHIEIGMGKGQFLYTLARQNPDIYYIGIEKYSSVLVRAVQKQEQKELGNLIFIRMDAEAVEEVFAPGEVGRIYINFCDPFFSQPHNSIFIYELQ